MMHFRTPSKNGVPGVPGVPQTLKATYYLASRRGTPHSPHTRLQAACTAVLEGFVYHAVIKLSEGCGGDQCLIGSFLGIRWR